MTTTAITYAEQERLEHIIGMIDFARGKDVGAVEIATVEWLLMLIHRLDERVEAARAEQREADAKIADDMAQGLRSFSQNLGVAQSIAEVIRSQQ